VDVIPFTYLKEKMNRNFDFHDDVPKNNKFREKKRNKKFVSEESYDKHKLNNQFKKKKKELEEEETWQNWDKNDEIY
jgi:hypothetical protein